MIVLIDGDLISYPCAAASEHDPEDIALFRCNDVINRILYETAAGDYELYIRGEGNYRYGIYPEYKGNRTKDAPKHLERCREYLVTTWAAKFADGIETDDCLGIAQTKYGLDSIIASYDKDLLQVPGWHYNFKKGIRSLVSPYEGLRNFYKQLIAGDGADNIPSYDGKIRNKTPLFIQALQKPLDEMTDNWDMYQHCKGLYFGMAGNDDNDYDLMERNAKLLYILREEGVHWHAPEEPQNTNPDSNQEQPV